MILLKNFDWCKILRSKDGFQIYRNDLICEFQIYWSNLKKFLFWNPLKEKKINKSKNFKSFLNEYLNFVEKNI